MTKREEGKNERRRVHVAKKTEKQTTEIDRHAYRRVEKLKGDRVTAVVEMKRRKKNEGRCMNTIRARAAYEHVGKPFPTGFARTHAHTHTCARTYANNITVSFSSLSTTSYANSARVHLLMYFIRLYRDRVHARLADFSRTN